LCPVDHNENRWKCWKLTATYLYWTKNDYHNDNRRIGSG
jgi:hypothetical protein